MMHILITGASGFIGNYFQQHYASKYTCSSFPFSEYNLSNLTLEGIETIIHLAAIVHQPNARKEEYTRVNVNQTLEFAKKAKENGVKHFLFMSTIAVYDSTLSLIQEDSLVNPITLYGQSKLEAERQLLALSDEAFNVSIIRPPMVYGENAPGNIRSLINLIDKMPILPFGKINNKRSFVYVGNLCSLMDCIIQSKKGGIFLASDDMPQSTTKLIELIAKAKNKKIYLFHMKAFQKLILWLRPSLYQRLFESLEINNSRTKEILNFKNPYSIEDGMKIMVKGTNV